MSGNDSLIGELVEVDAFIASGLAAFDRLMNRLDAEEIKRASRRMARDGHGQGDIDAFAEARHDVTKQARGSLVRELWQRGLQLFVKADSLFAAFPATALPAALLEDLLTASCVVRAGLEVADELVEAGQRRSALHRDLWSAALKHVTLAAPQATLVGG